MLVEKPKNSVVSIKLVNGEEIIAELVDVLENGNVQIRNPMIMVLTAKGNTGQATVAFSPWILGMSNNESSTLQKQHILLMVETRKDAAEQFVKATAR